MPPLILDGRELARTRALGLRARAADVLKERGEPPRLLLLAFATVGGEAPWLPAKLQACRQAGVDARTLILPSDVSTRGAREAFVEAMAHGRADAVFIQYPFPIGIDGDALAASIPRESDIDVMNPRSFRDFMDGKSSAPPLSVAGTLALLDAHRIPWPGRLALVVGHATPFNEMLSEAMRRKGARAHVAPPGSPELAVRLAESRLVVTSVAQPGALRSSELAPGAVIVDGGYFNPNGQGDVDLSDGIDHLAALAPVPGGIGPMTSSALVEAVISRAEAKT